MRLASPSSIFLPNGAKLLLFSRVCNGLTVNAVPWDWFRRTTFLWIIYFSIWVGSIIISYWSAGLCLVMVFQLIVLSLRMVISFNPLFSFTFMKDWIFRWRETFYSIVMRLRRYLTCLMFPRILSSSASWFRWISRWFVASLFMSFRYFFTL